ncbi:MAG: tetratricopeptide repeat protein [Bdellovibrionota bacterium]
MDEFTERRAGKLLDKGMGAAECGRFREARDHFKSAAKAMESADALTYWGWMEHHLGNTQFAIYLCKRAIQLDPEFGNPYNDIGSYLMNLNRMDEAIPWLEKAAKASRYEPRHYPHMNLGRIYLAKRLYLRALKEFKKALEYSPDDRELQSIIAAIHRALQ